MSMKKEKRKLKLWRSINNNFFAIRLIWSAAPFMVIFILLNGIIWGGLNFLTGSYLLRSVINLLENAKNISYIIGYIVVIGILQIVWEFINQVFWSVLSPKFNARINSRIDAMMFEKSVAVEYACYDDPTFYDKHVKAMDAAREHIWGVIYELNSLIERIILIFANSLLIFIIDPVLILFALFPLALGFVKKKAKKLKHDYDVSQKPYNRRKNYVQRSFYLPEYAKEIRLMEMWRQLIRDWWENFEVYKKNLRYYGWRRALTEYASVIGLEVVTIIGATFYSVYSTLVSETMLPGDCIVIINSIGDISYSLLNLVTGLANLSEHALYIEDLRWFLEYEPKIKSNEDGKTAASGDICFDNVTFRYTGAESDTLSNVSFTIKKGERIALVGQNGSGKTTLVKLMLHLYEPTNGKITLDGDDYCSYSLKSYRELYSVVFQDYRSFSLTVAENILMKDNITEAEREAVVEALKNAGVYEKVASLPNGIDTVLTREFDDEGAVLSGGESQKISLARVFAEKRDIAILDEPTSALDPIAEYNMFENMMKVTEGKTVLFISHRMSSATLADRVFLMDKGRLVESGTHCELMERNGLYAEMFRRQAKNYLGEEAFCHERQ